jgi:hypothetical protein
MYDEIEHVITDCKYCSINFRRLEKIFRLMGKFGSKKPLNSKQKQNLVEVNTPPREISGSLNADDLQSQYLSICYLLQAESEASRNLVHENMVLSRMLERLNNGSPRDIEELTLSTFASALGWVSPDVVDCLLKEGLVEFCHQKVLRYIENDGANSRSGDRSCELSIDLMCDLLNLEDKMVDWLLANLDMYLRLLQSTHLTYPSVVIKRCCARLVSDLVQLSPRAFVPGIPESRISSEAAHSLFSLCSSPDIETSCSILNAGLALESEFGSSVVPTVANMSINIQQTFASILHQSSSFIEPATDELELGMTTHRSQVRGISALLGYLCDGIEEAIGDINDSIENQKFGTVAKISSVEIEVFKTLISQPIDFDAVSDLVQKFTSTLGTSVMTDSDVSNIFDMVSKWIRFLKTPVFRIKEFRSQEDQIRLVQFAARTIGIVESSTADLSTSNALVAECLDVIVVSLLSSLGTRLPEKSTLLNSMTEFIGTGLKPLARESIEILDSSTVSEDQDKIAIACIQTIDLLYRLDESKLGPFCAECLASCLATLSEEHISVDVCCALMEAVFVVFGETYHDDSLVQINAQNIFSSISQYLQKHTDRSDNVRGTIENIQAFIDYKRNQ